MSCHLLLSEYSGAGLKYYWIRNNNFSFSLSLFKNKFAASGEEGTYVLYADDDTDLIYDSEPRKKIQREADRSTQWVADIRMICAGAKTKLLVIATDQMRRSQL